jgi:hypothetical protein
MLWSLGNVCERLLHFLVDEIVHRNIQVLFIVTGIDNKLKRIVKIFIRWNAYVMMPLRIMCEKKKNTAVLSVFVDVT